MKYFVITLSTFTTVALGAEDVIHLKERSEPLLGEILQITDESVKLKSTVRLSGGQTGATTSTIPYSAIDYIEFAPIEGEKELLENPSEFSTEKLENLWDLRRQHLHRPRSNSGLAGLAYAERLLESESELNHRHAQDIFEIIQKQSWSTDDRTAANQGRLRAMIRLGQIREAVEQAHEMIDTTEDPRILIEANHVLAMVAFNRLKEIEKENPKWMEDDDVRPLRMRHFNDALDRFLLPYLFHGSHEELAARGLWSAVQVHLFVEDETNARYCAEDIFKLYPNTPFSPKAEEILVTLTNAP